MVGFSGNTLECHRYEISPLTVRNCTGAVPRVPLVYHAVGRSTTPPYTVRANAAANPDYRLHYLNDSAAADFTRQCGPLVHEAYKCFGAPAFRGDVFRFCALFVQGGRKPRLGTTFRGVATQGSR